MTAPNREGDVVLVPREPTEAMIEAATGSRNPVLNTERWDDQSVDVREVWQDMLSAAPAALQPSPDGVREKVARTLRPDVFSDDAETAHKAASPFAVNVVRRDTLALADEAIAAVLAALGEPVAWRCRLSSDGDWFDLKPQYVQQRIEDGLEVQPRYARQQAAPGSERGE